MEYYGINKRFQGGGKITMNQNSIRPFINNTGILGWGERKRKNVLGNLKENYFLLRILY